MDEAARFRFVVESDPADDALVRLLAPFMVQQAAVEAVEHTASEAAARTVIRASRLARRRAETLARRLEALPFVRSVGFGW
ncbi:MAG: hypothetical protein ACK4YQ_18785 [Phenylobacterium sp.]|uniref:hypothetical protein n=1 Tax=Phenylobacterium sp. TaxID=1871053 RepID=UPI00391C5806